MAKKNIGSSFDDFLQEESMLEEATAVAIKRVIAWQIAQEMEKQAGIKLPGLNQSLGMETRPLSVSNLHRSFMQALTL